MDLIAEGFFMFAIGSSWLMAAVLFFQAEPITMIRMCFSKGENPGAWSGTQFKKSTDRITPQVNFIGGEARIKEMVENRSM